MSRVLAEPLRSEPHPPALAERPSSMSRWNIWLLAVVYAFAMLDRQVVTIVAEPMKRDLGLSDWQVGAIGGLAFAILFTTAGLPIARIADRGHRPRLIAISIVVWSLFTVACGYARGFAELLAARIGVGLGEAGCTPAAHSYIGDHVAPERRGSAFAIYSLGPPLGALGGLAVGGYILDVAGWRQVFVAAGLPGLVLAAVVLVTMRDRRGLARLRASQGGDGAGTLRDALKSLRTTRAFWLLSLGYGATTFFYFGLTAFVGAFYMRAYGPSLADLAASAGLRPAALLGLVLGVLVGIGGLVGTASGGLLADRSFRRGVDGYARLLVAALSVALPIFAAALLVSDLLLSFALLGLGFITCALAAPAVIACTQALIADHMRATASAIQLFLTNVIGLAFGPLAVGLISDLLTPTLGTADALRWAILAASASLPIAIALFAAARHELRPRPTASEAAIAVGRPGRQP